MKHRLFNFAAAVSLLLCVATVGAWVRSSYVNDQLKYTSLSGLCLRLFYVHSSRGLVSLALDRYDLSSKERAQEYLVMIKQHPGEFSLYSSTVDIWFSPGLQFDAERRQHHVVDFGTETYVTVVFPYWLVVSTTALVPVLWAVARWKIARQNSRKTSCLCTTCGYDLRATPQRCPECGTVPVPSPGTAGEGQGEGSIPA